MKADEIKERFEKKYGPLRKLKIEEVGVDIYYRPITIEDAQHLNEKFKDLIADELTWNLEAIFLKSFDKEGKRIWNTEKDREFLRKNIPGPIVTRIINAMTGGRVDEAKKNSKRIHS